jgi:hypothetical protein
MMPFAMIGRQTSAALLALAAVLAVREAGATTATDVCPLSADPCVLSRTIVITSGSLLDFGTRALELRQGGVLDVRAGAMTIRAGRLRLAPGAALLGRGGATGGSVTVHTTGAIMVEAAGTTRARMDVAADAQAGTVVLDAGGDVTIAGTVVAKANTMAGRAGRSP